MGLHRWVGVLGSVPLFALHSDGISSRLEFERYRHLDIEEVADAMVRDHGKETHDVSVVVFTI